MKDLQPALIIFIKNPLKGKVKTRLAATMGDDEALRVYHYLLSTIHEVTLAVKAPKYVFYSDHVEENDLWSKGDFIKKRQYGATLGDRMRNALDEVMEMHGQAILIGSDTPSITPALLRQALQEVQRRPVVIGPSTDGGYYLVGLQRSLPDIFENIEWGTSMVFNQTIVILHELNIPLYRLPVLRDVDNIEDWQAHLETNDEE